MALSRLGRIVLVVAHALLPKSKQAKQQKQYRQANTLLFTIDLTHFN